MATVSGYTAEHMKAIEDATVVDAEVIGDNLYLITHDGNRIDAGSVRGPMPKGVVDPLGDTVPMRTPDGRIKGKAPVEVDDLANKAYVDTKVSARGIELGAGVDLNDITAPGIYTQTSNVEASSGTSYPAPYAGVLEVFNNMGSVPMVWQRYTPYGVVNDRYYQRAFYVSWYPWRMLGGDTGWVSSGLAFGITTGWRVDSYSLRRVGTRITGNVMATYSGATITTVTDANMADLNGVITMPTGWRNTGGSIAFVPVWREGFNNMWGRARNDGTGKLDVVHGSFAGQDLLNGAQYTFMIDYYTD